PITPTALSGRINNTPGGRHLRRGVGVYNNVPVPRNDMFVNYDWEPDDFSDYNPSAATTGHGNSNRDTNVGTSTSHVTSTGRPMIRLPLRRPDYYVNYADEDENM